MIIKFYHWVDADTEEEEVSIPGKFEVCSRCEGKGVHDHPAFSTGIAMREFDEEPDFKAAYFRGDYDVECTICKGKRVVETIDRERATSKEVKWWDEKERIVAATLRALRNEERFGF